MRVDFCEVEVPGNQEEHGAHSGKAHKAARFTFGRLKQAIDGIDNAGRPY
jgi:hypothetical protein